MVDPIEANVRIAEALGLDPTQIRSGGLTIRCDPALGPVAEVQMRLKLADNPEAIEGVLRRFRLVEIEDEAE